MVVPGRRCVRYCASGSAILCYNQASDKRRLTNVVRRKTVGWVTAAYSKPQ